ncbi:hypothetical protein GCM10011374_31640 [Kocuria dechangensis]|uniref:CAAX prenyl protease 2/Lysostaphin resistance protein A-like domain-containing protein n=1 Tax=Kocuria dechangensis TaxID=1176249 RepID=A0A917LYH2_9MICC|nr:CPBP family intramembrane glutamic endopeptidase [Kocuria dechangensis]GGG65458.1 hypothetical protein GCM10011374_31640 [Kocuria dechangensis]
MTTRAAPWGSVPAADDARRDGGVRLLPYHRLGHADPEHRWWKPLVELVILVASYLVLTVLFAVLWALGLMVQRGPDAVDEAFLDPATLDVMDPAIFFMLFFSVVLMIPAMVLARVVMGPRPVGLLLSVTGRLRWGFLGRSLAVGLAIYAIGYGAVSLFELTVLGSISTPRPIDGFWLILAMVVLVVPLQCAAEELVFRGYLLQTVGRWVRRPVFAILLPVPLFTLAHLYDVWGLLSVAVMAVVAGYLCWRTGGLEAAIGLHVANNVMVTLLAAIGWADPNATESSWVAVALTVLFDGVYALIMVRLAKKHGLEVTRTVRPPRQPVPWPGGHHGPGGHGGYAPVPGGHGYGGYGTGPGGYGYGTGPGGYGPAGYGPAGQGRGAPSARRPAPGPAPERLP